MGRKRLLKMLNSAPFRKITDDTPENEIMELEHKIQQLEHLKTLKAYSNESLISHIDREINGSRLLIGINRISIRQHALIQEEAEAPGHKKRLKRHSSQFLRKFLDKEIEAKELLIKSYDSLPIENRERLIKEISQHIECLKQLDGIVQEWSITTKSATL